MNTENPPLAPGNELVPGATTDPALSPVNSEALTAGKVAALVEKEIG